MSLSRVKLIVIAALVLLNSFFLILISIDIYEKNRAEREAMMNVCAILGAGGIEIVPESIKTKSTISAMRTARASEPEEAIASALLGTAEMSDTGVIYRYESAENGAAEFYSAGDFEVKLTDGAIEDGGDRQAAVRRLLQKMKIEASVEVPQNGGGDSITALIEYEGRRIINCSIDFIFQDGSLSTVRGRFAGGIEPLENGAGISQVSTALLQFMTAVKENTVECERILLVEAGYRHSAVGSFGEGILSPVWLITTEAGQHAVDSSTGDIWRL